MVDRWTEVVPGSDIWHSTRQLYDVVVLCIANRSTDDALVEVDANNSENAEMFRRSSSSSTQQQHQQQQQFGFEADRFRVAVAGCTTRAVATFGVIDTTLAVHLNIRCSLVQLPLLSSHDSIEHRHGRSPPYLHNNNTAEEDTTAYYETNPYEASSAAAAAYNYSDRAAQHDGIDNGWTAEASASSTVTATTTMHQRRRGRDGSPSMHDIREADVSRQSAAVEEWLQQSNDRRRRAQQFHH